MTQGPQRPFQMSPGMAKANKTAAGCGFWLALIPFVLLCLGIAAVVAVLVL